MTGLFVVLLTVVVAVTLLIGAGLLLALIGLAGASDKRHSLGGWLRRLLCRFLFDCFDQDDAPPDHHPA